MSSRRSSGRSGGGARQGIFAARVVQEEPPRPSHNVSSVRSQRVSALSARLEEAPVFIIHQDGTKEFQEMTLRELYNYVLATITKRPKEMAEHSKQSMKRARSSDAIPSILHPGPDPAESFISELGASATEGGAGAHHEQGTDESKSEQQQTPTDPRASKKVSFTSPQKQDKSKSPPTQSLGGHVTYRERLGGYLHPRDMRRLVTPFSTTNAPEIMVRRHVILMNCDPLRAIVLRDRLLVLVPDDSELPMLETLAKRIIGGREAIEESIFGENKGSTHHEGDKGKVFPGWSGLEKTTYSKKSESNVSGASDVTVEETEDESDDDSEDDEWDDLEGRAWIDLPFELKAVDAVLHTVAIMLSNDTELLQEAVYDTIDEVVVNGRAAMGDHNQKVLRALKNAIKEMSSRVNNLVRAITEALDDLEDLSLMNLSRLITHPELFIQPVSRGVLEEESDEPELILEAYMQQALSIENQLDLLKGQVATSEELMAFQLDTVRNRLLLIDAILSVVSLTVSIAALVGSFYGMNVIIGVEDDPSSFTKIVAGTSVACVVLLFLFLFIFYRALALPSVNLA